MKRTTMLKIVVALAFAVAACPPARADCPGSSTYFRSEIVTYYETFIDLPVQQNLTHEWECNIESSTNLGRVCHVRLRGVLHFPQYVPVRGQPPPRFPAIIYNHGSEEDFTGISKACEVANYFVPKGYIVFAPFRRGQGDHPNDAKSTGIYIETMLDHFDLNHFEHDTACSNRQCYKAELLKAQADEDVVHGLEYLENRAELKKERGGDPLVAFMGNSYGGAVTVFLNRLNLGHKAAVAFAPAAQNWDAVNYAYAAERWIGATPVQDALIRAAKGAKRPTFYAQAKWDYDTRATIDLAYAHAYGGSDPEHGKHFMASIFPWEKPGPDPENPDLPDYQSVHVGFAHTPSVWGPAVLDFLQRCDVK